MLKAISFSRVYKFESERFNVPISPVLQSLSLRNINKNMTYACLIYSS